MFLFFSLGPTEIIIIVLIIVLLFGAKKIPELMQGIGKGIKEFKKAATDENKNNDEKDNNKSSDKDKN